MLLHIHPDNPQPRAIETVRKVLEDGGIIIYPTDTLYAFGCDPFNAAAVEKLCRIKGIKTKDARFSIVCADLSDLSKFAKSVDSITFRILKATLPGPYTFILPASKEVPKLLKQHRDAIGIRVPRHCVPRDIIAALGRPLMSASLPTADADVEAYTDPEQIEDIFGRQVDIVINSGYGSTVPSTVIDCTGETPEVTREGAGPVDVI